MKAPEYLIMLKLGQQFPTRRVSEVFSKYNRKLITPQVAMCVDYGTLEGPFSFFFIRNQT